MTAMNPVILYDGRPCRVTPDTAADLVGRGLAVLVEGSLAAPLPPDPEPDPEPKPKPRKRA